MPEASDAVADELAELQSRAFPRAIQRTAERLIRGFPAPEHRLDRFFTVTVNGEALSIPYRIYNPEPPKAESNVETRLGRVIRLCFYSRHHDGFVRQRSVRELVTHNEAWIAPFVVQLVGEYVLEIIEDIAGGLDLQPGSENSDTYGRFLADNEPFLDITSRRVTSYWNCHYRDRYPVMRPNPGSRFERYPGFSLIEALRATAERVAGRATSSELPFGR